jgi:hypothetical protein
MTALKDRAAVIRVPAVRRSGVILKPTVAKH